MEADFNWAVIGAGPAGIAAVGRLIDAGIPPKKIAWIDPEFKTGDFGRLWSQVPSNTSVRLFSRFFEASSAFHYSESPHFAFKEMEPDSTCLLGLAAEPLSWITDRLRQKVSAIQGYLVSMALKGRFWHLNVPACPIRAKSVILAIGATPNTLNYPALTAIPLATALNPSILRTNICNEDTVAVFGSSHSAILVLRNLLETTDVNRVINFYRSPLLYAIYMNDRIIFDDTGLKGSTAAWARENIDGACPPRLTRAFSDETQLKKLLPFCNKAVYATGFERRNVAIEGLGTLTYNPCTGIIAPGLFGFGIAFPEAKQHDYGLEYRVGLWKFMDYINRVLPIWLAYPA